jgi:hypothetical protein
MLHVMGPDNLGSTRLTSELALQWVVELICPHGNQSLIKKRELSCMNDRLLVGTELTLWTLWRTVDQRQPSPNTKVNTVLPKRPHTALGFRWYSHSTISTM